MKHFIVVIGFILFFFAGYFVSQRYNFKIEEKKSNPTPTIEVTNISPTLEVQITPEVQATPTKKVEKTDKEG